MIADVFRFKQFSVNQDNVAMRINTDGVLLGAWCNLPLQQYIESQGVRILDVGTGSGVIALMIAQRAVQIGRGSNDGNSITDNLLNISIIGIDSDIPSAKRAAENFKSSSFEAILHAKAIDLQSFTTDKFDLIVSNPPYFINSLKSPSARKNQARHTDTLPYKELIQCSLSLLKDNGTLAVVLPFIEAKRFEQLSNENYLYVKRRCDVFTKGTDIQPKRTLIEFCKGLPAVVENKPLAIRDAKGCYTADYQRLMSDYLLAF